MKRTISYITLLLLVSSVINAFPNAEPIVTAHRYINSLSQSITTWNIPARTRTTEVSTLQTTDPTLITAIKSTIPSVVTILSTETVPSQEVSLSDLFNNDPILKQFGIDFENIKVQIAAKQKVSSGSGFIANQNGYIVTNNHVVDTENASLSVVFYDGSRKPASVIYRDVANDIAVVKVDGSFSQVATLGDSSNLQLGQSIASIGNAYGQQSNSVSLGTISGFNENITAINGASSEDLSGLIKSNAKIVPGYSGGPVIDSNGTVVAMNVATGSKTSYLIPINTVKNILANYL